MVDNFDTIRRLICGKTSDDEFYFLQISQRRKDIPDLSEYRFDMFNLFIWNDVHLMEKKDFIIDQCDKNNARAYFRLNKRNKKKVALETFKIISNKIANEDYTNYQSAYWSAAGQFHSDDVTKWIVDVDGDVSYGEINEMISVINELEPDNKHKNIVILPSKNGLHLITTPFRLDKFKEIYPNIDVLKDNPTVLYSP